MSLTKIFLIPNSIQIHRFYCIILSNGMLSHMILKNISIGLAQFAQSYSVPFSEEGYHSKIYSIYSLA